VSWLKNIGDFVEQTCETCIWYSNDDAPICDKGKDILVECDCEFWEGY